MSSFLQRLGLKKTSANKKNIISNATTINIPIVRYLLFKNRPELENVLAQQNLTPKDLDYLLKNYTYEYSGTNIGTSNISKTNTNKLSKKMEPKVLNAINELATNPKTRELFIKFVQKINGKKSISEREINFLNNPDSYNIKNVAEEINRIQTYIRDEIIINYNNGIINKEKFIDLCKSLRGAIDTIIIIKGNKIIYSYYDKNIDLLKQFSNAMIKSNNSSNLYKLLPQNEQELINAEKVLAQYKIFLSYDKTKENYNKYVKNLNDLNEGIALKSDFKNTINLIKKSLKIKYNSLQYENKVNNHRNAIINREGYLFGQNGGNNLGEAILGGFCYLLYIIFAFILCGVIAGLTSPIRYYKSRKNKPENNIVVNYIPLPDELNAKNSGIGIQRLSGGLVPDAKPLDLPKVVRACERLHKGGYGEFAYCLASILGQPVY